MFRSLLLMLALGLAPVSASAQAQPDAETDRPALEGPMTPERLNAILTEVDPAAQVAEGAVLFTVVDVPVTVIYDASANRMRALVPIASVENVTEDQMMRLLQANFDSALDARYAIAGGRIWSVFLHPLAELDRPRLLSGVAQAVSLAQSFGTTYSSTDLMFMQGDSAARLEELRNPDTAL